ncbi:hypothetical protein GQ44DRAFT_355790 [Phaeosphaeriaceae sp. PMI808]|nr:hypothetical protein GQ44DRAFT_355790 [Phaeosphaeriaceae sp. PMI808]
MQAPSKCARPGGHSGSRLVYFWTWLSGTTAARQQSGITRSAFYPNHLCATQVGGDRHRPSKQGTHVVQHAAARVASST